MSVPAHAGCQASMCPMCGVLKKSDLSIRVMASPAYLTPHQVHAPAIFLQAFFKVPEVFLTGRCPAYLREGAGPGECLVVQAFGIGNPFRPYLCPQSLDPGMVFFLQAGENRLEAVCLLQGNSAVAVIKVSGAVEGIDDFMPVFDGVFSQVCIAFPEVDDGVCVQLGAGFASAVPR